MTDLELRALSVKCPLCAARPQALCYSTATVRVVKSVPHVARIDAYQRQEQK
jgi:hypothetical protein